MSRRYWCSGPVSYRRAPRAAGFTLIELLVAIVIFIVMSAMAYEGLRTVLANQDGFERNNDRLAELQILFLMLGRDIEQMVARPIRDNYGEEMAALVADDRSLEFSRTGWRNPAGFVRSHLQRVGYVVEENQLQRRSWAVLDRAPNSEPLQTVLLTGVEALELRFLDNNGQWTQSWPPFSVNDDKAQRPPLPLAVEVNIELDDWGKLTRLFRTPGLVQVATQGARR